MNPYEKHTNFLKQGEETIDYSVKSRKKVIENLLGKDFAILRTSKKEKECYYVFFE